MVQALVNNFQDTLTLAGSITSDAPSRNAFQKCIDIEDKKLNTVNFQEQDSSSQVESETVSDTSQSVENTQEETTLLDKVLQCIVPLVEQQTKDTNINQENVIPTTTESSENSDTMGISNIITSDEETFVNKNTDSKEIKQEVSLKDLVDEEVLDELNIESLEAGVANGNESGEADLMQYQTPQEYGIKVVLNKETDFSSIKSEAVSAEKQNNSSVEITPNKIIEQITKQMEGLHSGSKINMVLNPESLGKVSIQLINTKEGLSAQFTVTTQEARNLIMKGLDGLKDNLLSQGVNVDNVSVKVNNTQESEYNADWTDQEGSRGGNKEQGGKKKQKDEGLFDKMMSFTKEEDKEI